MSGLLNSYRLYPQTPDKNENYEFSGNPQYRQIVTKSLVHIMGSFIINNNLMSIAEIKEYGGWYNVSLWPKIRVRIGKWIPQSKIEIK